RLVGRDRPEPEALTSARTGRCPPLSCGHTRGPLIAHHTSSRPAALVGLACPRRCRGHRRGDMTEFSSTSASGAAGGNSRALWSLLVSFFFSWISYTGSVALIGWLVFEGTTS